MLPNVDSREHARLLARIKRHYDVVSKSIEIAHLSIPFTLVREPDRVLDQIIAAEDERERQTGDRRDGDELHLPYWAELWDSATGISTFLARRHARAWNADVLDLGCGMGLTGAVAAALGARVLFADLEAPALLFARLNSLPFDTPGRASRTLQLNWRTDTVGEQFHTIIGADVLYDRAQWDFLEPFWRNHLLPGGTVFLGEPGRQTGDKFPDWITPKGWNLTLHEQPVPTRPKPIRLFEISIK